MFRFGMFQQLFRIGCEQRKVCPFVCENDDLMLREWPAEFREVTQARAVDDEGVEGVADAGATGLGVQDDLFPISSSPLLSK